ncbi:MAG: hypothetical protein WA637_01705 [Terriglobales bacterium]
MRTSLFFGHRLRERILRTRGTNVKEESSRTVLLEPTNSSGLAVSVIGAIGVFVTPSRGLTAPWVFLL